MQEREKNEGEMRDRKSQYLHIRIEVKSSHKKELEQWAGRLQTRRLIEEKCIKLEKQREFELCRLLEIKQTQKKCSDICLRFFNINEFT